MNQCTKTFDRRGRLLLKLFHGRCCGFWSFALLAKIIKVDVDISIAPSWCCFLYQQNLLFANYYYYYYYYYSRLTGFFPGQPGYAGTRKVNHSGFYWSTRWWGGSGISWTICKSFAPCSRQITTPVSHHCFYRPDALPAAQPTASKTLQNQQKSQHTTLWHHTTSI